MAYNETRGHWNKMLNFKIIKSKMMLNVELILKSV